MGYSPWGGKESDMTEEIWHICSNLTRKSNKRCREQIFLSVVIALRAWIPKGKMLINFFMLSFFTPKRRWTNLVVF